ncbi:MAG: exodeoxyribonuclease VII large subunit [Rhodospirillales bacterium]|nr:exodeoxyribonuclease VII large subunit [Rhodospirillales bacterium]
MTDPMFDIDASPGTDTGLEVGEMGGDNRPVFSVSELSHSLKRVVEDAFAHVRVRGEVSRLTLARSGHMYVTLKDENAVLDGVCWKGTVARLAVHPEEGMEVVVTGRLSTYGGRSSYQIVIEQMEMAGEGALLKLLEDRRKKLLAEGLFDVERKQPLPTLPGVIGVVTSPTGAVIRDILHRLRDRFPRHVLLWPTNVQGDGAAESIAAAIDGFNTLAPGGAVPRPDLLIIARGGGSLEDLWAFNEEVVVRAAAASDIPLISAVGHETDTTLIDFASDQRAPTPTAAAEMAVPVRGDLLAHTADQGVRLMRAMHRTFGDFEKDVAALARGIPQPVRISDEASQRLDDWVERLDRAKEAMLNDLRGRVRELGGGLVNPAQQIARKQDQLTASVRSWRQGLLNLLRQKDGDLERQTLKLEGVSYQRVLDRGFALVTDEAGTMVSAATATTGLKLNIEFSDGGVAAQITGEAPATSSSREPRQKLKPKPSNDDSQGSLL